MKPHHTETIGNLTLKVYPDTDSPSPTDDGDEDLFLAAWHHQFTPTHHTPAQVAALAPTHWQFALYAYVHSGVVLSLDPFTCPWDSGRVGFVCASRAEFDTKADARRAAAGLVETWNDVLSGNVWGYTITTPEGEDVDSCWGFIGPVEHALTEARHSAAAHLSTLQTNDVEAARYMVL